MNIGTKSLLYGGHQFILHPLFVYLAWIKVYRRLPSFWESCAIAIHDWGYWGKPNIDGPEGEDHPRWAAEQLHSLTGKHELWELCNFHSRFQARRYPGGKPSKLCLPDKMGVAFLPAWLWVALCTLSGELKEYQTAAKYSSAEREMKKHPIAWFRHYRAAVYKWAKDGDIEGTIKIA